MSAATNLVRSMRVSTAVAEHAKALTKLSRVLTEESAADDHQRKILDNIVQATSALEVSLRMAAQMPKIETKTE